MLELIDAPSWANVIKVCRVFGVRSWEVGFTQAINDGDPAPRHQGQDLQHSRRVKEETDPLAEAVAVDGTTFGLVEGWDQLKLPHRRRENPRGCPAAFAYWQQLMAEYEARGDGCGLLTAGHIQRPGARDREGRHSDRGHGSHGGSSCSYRTSGGGASGKPSRRRLMYKKKKIGLFKKFLAAVGSAQKQWLLSVGWLFSI